MLNTWKNFIGYTESGIVPAKCTFNGVHEKSRYSNKDAQNSFYQSVRYIDSVVGPIKDMFFGVQKYQYVDRARSRMVFGTQYIGTLGDRPKKLSSILEHVALWIILYTITAFICTICIYIILASKGAS
ncbi:hypothetical protein [Wolbachia endosymbiont of Ctenocephalides felis wCfeT]|uniref:hypothetical protein n=1 Tax=Wolbachia endosymbiont of Ctenocephalides felis wCfeT TaxID=2732593 RepID=UPI001446A282|nr:hypothetical protein [Wolbachia endosymbiont of Ctenocephalides felis wCfeT]